MTIMIWVMISEPPVDTSRPPVPNQRLTTPLAHQSHRGPPAAPQRITRRGPPLAHQWPLSPTDQLTDLHDFGQQPVAQLAGITQVHVEDVFAQPQDLIRYRHCARSCVYVLQPANAREERDSLLLTKQSSRRRQCSAARRGGSWDGQQRGR